MHSALLCHPHPAPPPTPPRPPSGLPAARPPGAAARRARRRRPRYTSARGQRCVCSCRPRFRPLQPVAIALGLASCRCQLLGGVSRPAVLSPLSSRPPLPCRAQAACSARQAATPRQVAIDEANCTRRRSPRPAPAPPATAAWCTPSSPPGVLRAEIEPATVHGPADLRAVVQQAVQLSPGYLGSTTRDVEVRLGEHTNALLAGPHSCLQAQEQPVFDQLWREHPGSSAADSEARTAAYRANLEQRCVVVARVSAASFGRRPLTDGGAAGRCGAGGHRRLHRHHPEPEPHRGAAARVHAWHVPGGRCARR